ncbi:MAG: SDR family NAD(P)-dependent oxidoreductase [Prevotellaceae bacterium]|jgi:short-subunit dehydrogenase|nr:SDR family NAD(P)-dependent oxidoreductase [Prevotellaceae bacterium]
MKVKNKTIVVTGGGNGLGREIVLNLLDKGARVIAVDMNETALEETFNLSKKNKGVLIPHIADITSTEELKILRDKTINLFGAVDGVINNAGIIQPFVKLNDLDFEIIKRVMNVNFIGMANVTKTFLPQLLSRSESHIVNVSSLGGIVPTAGQISYCASKAAVKQFSDCLRSELSETNVRVTTIFPGAMQTNIKINSGLMREAESTDAARAGNTLHPTLAAEHIVAAMEHNRKSAYLGKDSKSMHFISKISSTLATKLIYSQVKYKFN